MEVDIRLPIGFMFALLGLLLLLFGLTTQNDPELYQRSLNINVNLWTGLVMLVFGALMLFFGIRAKRIKSKQP
jgi:membrane-bound ClpP family serine protease